MKRSFPTEVVLSLSTGILLCDFGAMQELAEFLSGSPVFTHQFAHKPLWEEWRRGLLAQLPQIESVNAEAVTKENWEQFLKQQIAAFGPTLEVAPLSRLETLGDAFTKPLEGKQVLVLDASQKPTEAA